MDTLGNVGALFLEGHQYIAGLVIEPFAGVIIADSLNCVSDNLLVVNGGIGADLSQKEDHSSLGSSFCINRTGDTLERSLIKELMKYADNDNTNDCFVSDMMIISG